MRPAGIFAVLGKVVNAMTGGHQAGLCAGPMMGSGARTIPRTLTKTWKVETKCLLLQVPLARLRLR